MPVEELGGWSPIQEAFTHVFGFSGLGHLFLLNAGTSEYAVHHPLVNAYKSYGSFDSCDSFERSILMDSVSESLVLRLDLQQEIATRLGPLQRDQVYIPTPYPFLGGDENDPTSYNKGDVWVFLSIVHQMLNRRRAPWETSKPANGGWPNKNNNFR
ncbi:T6SS immunity protein Tdi1 domain-containing protein [Arthrobacter sp. NA-172]|uniref:T6SS immunity protein Tdi1 domain-containing protein n=1 Tax=Arthrobacter sp. NA-172 TaxID=3367524 RepID=UPI003754EDAF